MTTPYATQSPDQQLHHTTSSPMIDLTFTESCFILAAWSINAFNFFYSTNTSQGVHIMITLTNFFSSLSAFLVIAFNSHDIRYFSSSSCDDRGKYRSHEHTDTPTLNPGLLMSAKLTREFLCFINSEVVNPDGALGLSADSRPWSSITNGCNAK